MLSYSILCRGYEGVKERIEKLNPTMSEIFSELDDQVLRVVHRRSRWALAAYDWRFQRIEMNFDYFVRDIHNKLPFVLAHETTHAAQHIARTVPFGEKSCDVFALARLPVELYPKQDQFYVRIPRKLLSSNPEIVKKTAERAIQLRAGGLRRYILWFQAELKEIASYQSQLSSWS